MIFNTYYIWKKCYFGKKSKKFTILGKSKNKPAPSSNTPIFIIIFHVGIYHRPLSLDYNYDIIFESLLENYFL